MMINEENPVYRQAVQDFRSAHQRAAIEEVLSRVTGRSNELLSYEEVARKLKLQARSERGRHNIPLNAIVGSVGRYTDFTRTFMPRHNSDEDRWAKVKAAINSDTSMPPIEVYKVSDVYFVLDGNHRVSVARQEGWQTIEAHVIELQSNIALTPDMKPDDLIVKAEYAEFLEETDILSIRPGIDLSTTIPGQYEFLREHIQVHRYYMGLDFQRDIPYEEALGHWYDEVYLPMVEIFRERGMLRWFPDRTETDLYLWVSEHRASIEKELGWSIRPEIAADLVVQESAGDLETGSWRQSRLMDRYTGHLFEDILVPISGQHEGWLALEQAIIIARREGSHLHGLHIVSTPEKITGKRALSVQKKFEELCANAGLQGTFAVESGEPARKIMERAVLTDLVVMRVIYPPSAGLSGLASPVRAIISRSPRPILALPDVSSSLERAVLAFDGSAKSKEALFVAAYLAEEWHTQLTVFTATDGTTEAVQDYARQYLELHEVQAEFVTQKGGTEALKTVAIERNANLVLMGGYSGAILKEMTIGSSVNYMLRESTIPVLICR